MKGEYNKRVDIRDHLKPKAVVDLLAQRVRGRIASLEGTRLTEYTIAVYELRVMLDLLQRASNYIERGEGKKPRG
jgi:hypothetical protein